MKTDETCWYQGHAIKEQDYIEEADSEDCDVFACSNCSSELAFMGTDSWFSPHPKYKPYFDYCPFCGRKVLGVQLLGEFNEVVFEYAVRGSNE